MRDIEPTRATLCSALALLITLGCSGDGTTILQPPTQPAPEPEPEPVEDPLYLLATGVCGPDSCQTYLSTTTSLDPRSIDTRGQGLELEGFVYPFLHHDALIVPEGESPALTRYTLDASSDLRRDVTLSFAGVGFSGSIGAGRARIINDEKAYLFDEANRVIHLWNPADMTLLDREIDISLIQREGYDVFVAGWENAARRRGDLLLLPVGWGDPTTFDLLPVAGLLVIDTVRDEVVKLLEDSRCPWLESSVLTDSGDLYYGFPSAAAMLDVNVRDPSFGSCSLRILDGETEFDPDYLLDVSGLVGGRIGCCGAPAGGSKAYVQVLHEERATVSPRSELFGGAHNDWRLWRIDLESEQAEEVTTLPWFGTSGVGVFETPQATYFPMLVFAGDSGGLFSTVGRSTTLVDVTSRREPTPTISTDGSLLFFARVR
jgi:hypothetical protein